MRLGIRHQLLFPLIILMIGMVAMSLWTALSAAGTASRRIDRQMDDIAATVGRVRLPLNHQVLTLMKGMSGAEFLVCESVTQPMLDDRDEPLTTLTALPSDLPSPEDAREGLGPRVHVGARVYFCRGVYLGHDTHRVVYVFYPESLWKEAWWQAVRPALVIGGLGGIAAFVLAVVVAARVTRPIQDIERRTRLIAAGDFGPMPLPTRNDELRDLAGSINDMASRLAQFQETVRKTERLRLLGQVSGGLAHQLRNGVTGANLAVQLHAQECPSGVSEESLAVALRQLALVEMHLKRFLHVGKALDLRRESCSLLDLIQEAGALLFPKCKHAGIDLDIEWEGPDDGWTILGDHGQLAHLFLNVLTNAAEAAGPGGRVDVRVSRDDAMATVQIFDSGPGPDPEVAARLFEPFVTGKPEGVGLGLAVARQVAEAHGGSISWRRDDDHTCFRIDLPLTPLLGREPHADQDGNGERASADAVPGQLSSSERPTNP